MKKIKLDSLVWINYENYKITGTVTGWTKEEGEITMYRMKVKGYDFLVRPNQITTIR